MTDLVERLRDLATHPGNEHYTAPVLLEAAAEIERLRGALRTCPCPGGGWNGMPADLEPTVAACVDNKVCGCVYGAALSGEQRTPVPDKWELSDETKRALEEIDRHIIRGP